MFVKLKNVQYIRKLPMVHKDVRLQLMYQLYLCPGNHISETQMSVQVPFVLVSAL